MQLLQICVVFFSRAFVPLRGLHWRYIAGSVLSAVALRGTREAKEVMHTWPSLFNYVALGYARAVESC